MDDYDVGVLFTVLLLLWFAAVVILGLLAYCIVSAFGWSDVSIIAVIIALSVASAGFAGIFKVVSKRIEK